MLPFRRKQSEAFDGAGDDMSRLPVCLRLPKLFGADANQQSGRGRRVSSVN